MIQFRLSSSFIAGYIFLAVLALWLSYPESAFCYPKNSHYGQIIEKELYLTTYDHKIPEADNADAWTFVTDGMKEVGQDEMILTVLNPKKLSYREVPMDIILFFKTVYELAKSGKYVTGGCYTEFGGKSYLVAPQFKGVLYLDGKPPSGVLAPLGSLVLVPATKEELEAYSFGGPLRVAGRLAIKNKFFPYPYWCDPERKSEFSQADLEAMRKSPLLGTYRKALGKASITSGPAGYRLLVPYEAQDAFIEILKNMPENSGLLLCLGIDPMADAAFVWSATDNLAAIAPGSKLQHIQGSYLLVLPNVEESEFRQYFDGYVVTLTKDQWTSFKNAIDTKQNVTLADKTKTDLNLVMEPEPEDVLNRSYTKTARWLPANITGLEEKEDKDSDKDKEETKEKNEAERQSSLDRIWLLTLDKVIEQSITVDDLTAYIKQLGKVTVDYFSPAKEGSKKYKLILQVHVDSGQKASFNIFHRPQGIPNKDISALIENLKKVEAADSTNPLDFELIMTVWQ